MASRKISKFTLKQTNQTQIRAGKNLREMGKNGNERLPISPNSKGKERHLEKINDQRLKWETLWL